MFPKGKFNTDISRNAQYMVLFRSPSDRKQIDIIAERIFAKDRSSFMEIYARETAKPFGYVLVDNQPKTSPNHQVVSNIFGECQRYLSITTDSSREAPVVPVKRKVQLDEPPVKKPKRENQAKPRAVNKSQKKQTKRKPTQKPKKSQTRQQTKTQRKPAKKPKTQPKSTPKRQPKKQVETARYNDSPQYEISDSELNYENTDVTSGDEETYEYSSNDELSHMSEFDHMYCTQDQLNELAKQDYRC